MKVALAAALAGLALLTTTTHPAQQGTGCLEDEVRMYEGQCVPLDDIQEAAVDLYLEAVSQQ